MTEKKRKPSYDAVLTATFRLLNALVRKEEFLNDPRVTENTFTDETAKSVFIAIQRLHESHLAITPASLLQMGQEIDFNITSQIVQNIFNIDTKGADSLDPILHTLNVAVSKNAIMEQLSEIEAKISEPGDINVSDVLGKLYNIDKTVKATGKDETTLLDFDAWSDKYIEDLEARKVGRKYSFGDYFLDELIRRGAAPGEITIVAAATSMGKSTYVLSLMDGLLENNSPCMYLSLEMGTIDSMDRMISRRCGISNDILYEPKEMDGIIQLVKEEKANLSNRKKFYFCEASNVDLIKLRALIKEFKQKAHSDYGFVAIDLLSSMKGFMSGHNQGSTATNIEVNMNALEALAKEENVHILGVVQIGRQSEVGIKPATIDDIEKFRPKLYDVKNSGAYAEKASLLLCAFRKKYYADRYLPNDPGTEALEDILEIQILKDRNGPNAGKILKYMFDGNLFRLSPKLEEEEEDDSIDINSLVGVL